MLNKHLTVEQMKKIGPNAAIAHMLLDVPPLNLWSANQVYAILMSARLDYKGQCLNR